MSLRNLLYHTAPILAERAVRRSKKGARHEAIAIPSAVSLHEETMSITEIAITVSAHANQLKLKGVLEDI